MNHSIQNVQIRDEAIQEKLESDGYAVLSGISADTVARLLATVYEEVRTACSGKLNFNTGADLTGPHREHALACIKEAYAPILDRYFLNQDCILALLFVKRPSIESAGQIHLHCDPTLLPDESKQRHLNLWSPLVDVDETNGAMWVVPGAHKVFAPVHAFSVRSQLAEITETVMDHGRCVPTKAGEVLVFDNRMPHFSRQNRSQVDRPAAVLSIVPACAEFVSLFGSADGERPVEVFRQRHSWFEDMDWVDDSHRPKAGAFLGYLKWQLQPVSRTEFLARMEKGAGPSYAFELLQSPIGLS